MWKIIQGLCLPSLSSWYDGSLCLDSVFILCFAFLDGYFKIVVANKLGINEPRLGFRVFVTFSDNNTITTSDGHLRSRSTNIYWEPTSKNFHMNTLVLQVLFEPRSSVRGHWGTLKTSGQCPVLYIYIYIYIFVCVCVCVWERGEIVWEREREREGEKERERERLKKRKRIERQTDRDTVY